MTQFANLPDDCYLLIFVRLSTSTLLSCRRVSRAWLRNQLQVFRKRKVLVLLQGDSAAQLLTKSHFQASHISHGIDQNGQPMDFGHFLLHNQVKLRTFDQNVTHFLAENFPNLDTLFVVHRKIVSHDVTEPLLDLLQLFSSRVVTLKMYFNYRGKSSYVIKSNIREVIRQLNSMTALEHVTLESYNPPSLALAAGKYDLDFLIRIKEFYCYAPELSKSWHNAFQRLEQTGTVSQLEQIGLGQNRWALGDSVDQWPLANRFTHFPYYDHFGNVDNSAHFTQSIAHFRSLTSFTIFHNRNSHLASKLTTLSNHCSSLVHFKIEIFNRSLFVQPFDPTTIKPLESVKTLDLEFVDSRMHNLAQINLQAQIVPLVHTFPSLVSIKVISRSSLPSRDVECDTFFRQLQTSLGRESLRTEYRLRQHW